MKWISSLGVLVWAAAFALRSFVAAGAEVVSDEAVRKLFGWGRATNEVRRLSTDEAARALEEVFAKDKDYASEAKRRQLKRLLTDELGVMYSFDEVGDYGEKAGRLYHCLQLMRLMPVVYFLRDEVSRPKIMYEKVEWPDGRDEEVNADNWYLSSLGPLQDEVHAFETIPRRAEKVEREVIADVETVRFLSLTHCDISAFSKTSDGEEDDECAEATLEPRVNYLVTLRVRPECRGTNDFVRFSFPVVLNQTPLTPGGRWLFYRGITLAVGFATTNGVSRVARIDPVLPYPPYARQNIRLYDLKSGHRRGGEAGAQYDKYDPFSPFVQPSPRVRSLLVNYDDHTLVQYASETNLLSGCFGVAPDFTSTSRIRVWTDGDAARPDYWREAWFGFKCDGEDYFGDEDEWGDARVKVTPAVEYEYALADTMPDAETAYAFSLRGLRVPRVLFRPPATMAGVAEYMMVAVKSYDKGRRLYTVSADESCANRVVRPYEATDIELYRLFENLCRLNGCAFSVAGTNVTISATVSEADREPPKLDALLKELEGLGFASLRGATLTRGSFHSNVKWADDEDYDAAYIQPSYDDRMQGCMWMLPVEGVTNRVRILARDCVWWEVARGESKTEPDFVEVTEGWSVRLRRMIARRIFKLEENPDVPANHEELTFALQLYSAGYRAEAERLVALIWRHPWDAKISLGVLRAQVTAAAQKFPTAAAWIAVCQREAEANAAKKAAEAAKEKANGNEKHSEEDDDEEEE